MAEGRRIREYVETFAPTKAQTIQNPDEHYAAMFEEYVTRRSEVIAELEPEGKQATDEERANPLLLMGKSRANRKQAEEVAWQEVVLDRYPPEVDETGTPLED
ncbi:hypothetical protein BI49514_02384 [Brevibacterium iodinum ATCC 49514]|uniref:Uncharacterized protein n=2 Tax=Brevibacterium iodinum TaxID=31943 RepID=A0A2H1JUW0_9MICO|nr:hypothetical protein BI49514_02384 [Brevibacterium iodinum ATCC 49514]SUW70182.1 Uncharacterised protein [Brevibacterium iodinum]